MLPELQELVSRIINECEDQNALDAKDMAYLEQIQTAADLMNFEDSDDDKMYSLAISAAKAIGQSPEWIAQKDAERYSSPVLSSPAGSFGQSGLGIGGLANYVEPVGLPSVAAIKRQERIEREMQVCNGCGQSDLIDGAMFTTMAGSGYCDDCC